MVDVLGFRPAEREFDSIRRLCTVLSSSFCLILCYTIHLKWDLSMKRVVAGGRSVGLLERRSVANS